MFEILTLATSLFTATPAVAQETTAPAAVAAPATPAAAAIPATPVVVTPAPATPAVATVPAAAVAPAAPATAAAPPSIWQSLGNQVIAHDTMSSMDTDGSKTISRAEYTAYQDAQFKLLDTNNDGLISTDEVGTNKKKSLPSLPSLPSFW